MVTKPEKMSDESYVAFLEFCALFEIDTETHTYSSAALLILDRLGLTLDDALAISMGEPPEC